MNLAPALVRCILVVVVRAYVRPAAITVSAVQPWKWSGFSSRVDVNRITVVPYNEVTKAVDVESPGVAGVIFSPVVPPAPTAVGSIDVILSPSDIAVEAPLAQVVIPCIAYV